jgi:hypothetical protein
VLAVRVPALPSVVLPRGMMSPGAALPCARCVVPTCGPCVCALLCRSANGGDLLFINSAVLVLLDLDVINLGGGAITTKSVVQVRSGRVCVCVCVGGGGV